jgi:opacity protein-like surface antigen
LTFYSESVIFSGNWPTTLLIAGGENMRIVTVAVAVLSISLMLIVPAPAGELQLAKVYRDYPGYINPAVCENPNLDKPVAGEPAVRPADPPTEAVKSPVVAVPVPVQPASGQAAEPAGKTAPVVKAAPAVVKEAPAAVKETPVVKSLPVVNEPKAVAPAAEVNRQCESVPYSMLSDDPVGVPYLSAWAGIVATHDADTNTDIDVAFDNGYGVGVAVGHDFGPVRLEIEASHRESNIEEVTVSGNKADSDGDLEVQALLINGFADFKTGGNLTPYLGVGVGFAKVELGDDDDEVLAGQVAAGVLIAVSPAVAIDLGYRFMMTDDPEIGSDEYEVRQHTALLGVQIRF